VAIGDHRFNNKVSAMFAELPVHERRPLTRLRLISEQMQGLKESREAVAGEALTSLAGFAPPMLLGVGLRLASRLPQRNLNTVTTNVPGPQLPLYMLGRRMLKAYPYVPLWGSVRVTIAIFSYDGQVSFGVTGDYDAARDIDVLCRGIERGVRELLRLVGSAVREAARSGAPERHKRARAHRHRMARAEHRRAVAGSGISGVEQQ
jgi:hypothetical protein